MRRGLPKVVIVIDAFFLSGGVTELLLTLLVEPGPVSSVLTLELPSLFLVVAWALLLLVSYPAY